MKSDLDVFWDPNSRLDPGLSRATKSDSVNVYEARKPFQSSLVKTVEVNVVASERGDDNLSVTSRSGEKIPVKNIPHYTSIYENTKVHALRWSNRKNQSLNSDSINEIVDDKEYESATLIKDEHTDKTNKPYESSALNVGSWQEEECEVDEKDEIKQPIDNRCAQKIPILSMKKKQIPPPLNTTISVSPPRYSKVIVPSKAPSNNTLETPMNRQRILLKNNCNSDIGLKKTYYDEMIRRDTNYENKEKSMMIVKPKKNFRLKFSKFKKHTNEGSASPMNQGIARNTPSHKKEPYNHPQYLNTLSKKKNEDFNESVKSSMGGYPSSKLLLSNKKNIQKGFYVPKHGSKRELPMAFAAKDIVSKDRSPRLGVPKSPQYTLTKMNKMLSSERKVVDFNNSYDKMFRNSPMQSKKVSPNRPRKLKKGPSIEMLKESMISQHQNRTDSKNRGNSKPEMQKKPSSKFK